MTRWQSSNASKIWKRIKEAVCIFFCSNVVSSKAWTPSVSGVGSKIYQRTPVRACTVNHIGIQPTASFIYVRLSRPKALAINTYWRPAFEKCHNASRKTLIFLRKIPRSGLCQCFLLWHISRQGNKH